jgi:hypothetical protein
MKAIGGDEEGKGRGLFRCAVPVFSRTEEAKLQRVVFLV